MSGAEFAFVIGVLSGTITVVDSVFKIYSSARNNTIPQTFRDAALKIPFFKETLKGVEKRMTECHVTQEHTLDVKDIIQNCKGNVGLLEWKIRQGIPRPYASRISRFITSARAHRDSERVMKLTKGILEDIQLLGQWLAIQPQVETELRESTSTDNSLSSSIPSSYCGDATDFHPVHRTLHIHSRPGERNFISGSGAVYIGSRQIFNSTSH